MHVLMAKRCSGCKQELSVEMFYVDRSRPDGLQSSCKECSKRSARERYQANSAKRVQQMGSYYQGNKRRLNEARKGQQQRHGVEHSRRYRARKRQVTVHDVRPRDIERLVRRHGGMCAYCHERPFRDLDHVVPLVRGGSHSIGNLLPACQPCNTSKGARLLIEWRNRAA